jgi:hypothetical protein
MTIPCHEKDLELPTSLQQGAEANPTVLEQTTVEEFDSLLKHLCDKYVP